MLWRCLAVVGAGRREKTGEGKRHSQAKHGPCMILVLDQTSQECLSLKSTTFNNDRVNDSFREKWERVPFIFYSNKAAEVYCSPVL